MKRELALQRLEPLDAVIRHPVAGVVGGVLTALACGGIGAAAGSPTVAILMTLLGFAIGAPGAAHIAESASDESRSHIPKTF
jgi:hypothetical protein